MSPAATRVLARAKRENSGNEVGCYCDVSRWRRFGNDNLADEITEHPSTRIGSVSFVDAKMLENNEKSKM